MSNPSNTNTDKPATAPQADKQPQQQQGQSNKATQQQGAPAVKPEDAPSTPGGVTKS